MVGRGVDGRAQAVCGWRGAGGRGRRGMEKQHEVATGWWARVLSAPERPGRSRWMRRIRGWHRSVQ